MWDKIWGGLVWFWVVVMRGPQPVYVYHVDYRATREDGDVAFREAVFESSPGGSASHNKPYHRHRRIVDYLENINHGHFRVIAIPPIDLPDFNDDLHDKDYVEFLKNAWSSYSAVDLPGKKQWVNSQNRLVPISFADRRRSASPRNGDFRDIGYYAEDPHTPIGPDTYRIAADSFRLAQYVAEMARPLSEGYHHQVIYAATVFPGHHASPNRYGGYSFFNNALGLATALFKNGLTRVAILDLDFHAGHGTQEFIDSDSFNFKTFHPNVDAVRLLSISIHSDPKCEYPFYWGHANADTFSQMLPNGFSGGGRTSVHFNYVLQPGTTFSQYMDQALKPALDVIQQFQPEVVVIPFGFDTWRDDPETVCGPFQLEIADYQTMGSSISQMIPNIPKVITAEGGYGLTVAGHATVEFLLGLDTHCVSL